MMTKKPGPPVPPRPHSNLMKSQSESSSSRTGTKVTSSSSFEAGRTVIYKSPSFDLKKRQHDQKNNQEQNCIDEQQQQIFIIDNPTSCAGDRQKIDGDSSMANQTDKNIVTIEKKANRAEIVIINNKASDNSNKNNFDPNENNNIIPMSGCDNDIVHKISPIPKPRTLLLAKTPKSQSLDNQVVRSHSAVGNISIARSAEISRSQDCNLNNNINTTASITKTIEMENNLKNAAERLFTEIIVNQTKNSDTIENIDNNNKSMKTEHCISVRKPSRPSLVPSNSMKSNRTCVNLSHRPEPEGGENLSLETPGKIISNGSTDPIMPSIEKKVAFHEILISELTAMRQNSMENDCDEHDLDHIGKVQKHDQNHHHHHHNQSVKQQRKRYPSGCSTDSSPYGTQRSRIRTSDWVEVGDNGKEVMLTSCHISLEDSGLEDEERLDDTSSGVGDSWDSVKDAEERMSLPGLPPLPKSLSGLELTGVPVHNSTGSLASLESQRGISTMSRMTATPGGGTTTTTTTLDTQLAVLRREMFGLRQLDLSLLSQLWALNESIQEFRTMLQEQETLSPPSPSPSPSDANSVSSCDEDDIPSIGKTQLPSSMQRMRSAPPPPPPIRKAQQRPV